MGDAHFNGLNNNESVYFRQVRPDYLNLIEAVQTVKNVGGGMHFNACNNRMGLRFWSKCVRELGGLTDFAGGTLAPARDESVAVKWLVRNPTLLSH